MRPATATLAPLNGLVGTVAGMLFTADRVGTEPTLEIVLEAVGFSLAVTAACLIVLLAAVRLHSAFRRHVDVMRG